MFEATVSSELLNTAESPLNKLGVNTLIPYPYSSAPKTVEGVIFVL